MSYTPHNFVTPMTQNNYAMGGNNQIVSKVIEVFDDDKVVLKDIYPKVLYFTAKWCGPCQRISPVYDELAKSNPEIKFFKIDVEKNEELAGTFGIKSMPTFFFFKSKKESKSFSGADVNKLKLHVSYLTN
jgi:thiol-disulfide isomerase/thioredoxin